MATITNKELIDQISEKTNNKRVVVKRIVQAFLDDIIDFSDTESSPTKFSHTVHNAAASYVATAINCRGPITTVTSFKAPYKAALMLAQCWLNDGRAKRLLVGYVETTSEPFDFIQGEVSLPSYSAGGIQVGA